MNFNKIKPYLPSKQFQKIAISLIILIALGFGIFYLFAKDEKFSRNADLEINKKTVKEVLETDTDGDGVLDWEETLWGTDKNKQYTYEGISDLDYISNKRSALNTGEGANGEEIKLTETDLFAREFFASYVALKGQEGITEDDILNFTNSLGKNISNQNLPKIYSKKQIKITEGNSKENQLEYYESISALFDQYRSKYSLGDELEIMSTGLVNYQNTEKEEKYNELLLIGEGYQEFAKEASNIPTPVSFEEYHLEILNNAHNTGLAILEMAKVTGDPIVGLAAINLYGKYSDALIVAVEKLEDFFE
ncbi:MAG: hypothetical protein KBD14_00130 [Candidatus Pacebacteria bacterium]|nr:hypothetical protein [Candidatus Paceibacterota bacterium]